MSNNELSGDRKTRCAIIGYGMGRMHAQAIAGFDDAEIIAVSDVTPERLEGAKSDHPQIEAYADYEEMLRKEQPDVVTIALPNFLHKDVTISALRAGCHVLCEKPMAMTVEEANEMLKVSKETDKILGINLSQLFNPTTDALRNWVKGGELGEVYHGFISWTRQNGIPGFGGWFGQKDKSGGGPLIDIGVHRLGLALHILGNPQPVRVSGFTQHNFGVPKAKELGKDFDVEDFAGASIRFENGTSLFLEVSWDGFQKDREELELRFHGTNGSIRKEVDKDYYYYGKKQDNFIQSRIQIPAKHNQSSYRSFIDKVRYGKPFAGSPELGIHLQQILNALYESAHQGREVEITF